MVCSDNLTATQLKRYSGSVTAAADTLLPGFMQRYLPTYALELDAFIAAVELGAPIEADLAASRRALLLADAARASLRCKAPVLADVG